MSKPLHQLSRDFHAVAALLDNGWSGTYGDLAVAIGRTARSGRVIGRLVKGYARRHLSWPHARVFSKRTGRPAYL
jgi:alkylated DNA nucleotide flippase Atl1